MIVTTADVIPGQAVQVLGLVRGNIVTSKNIGHVFANSDVMPKFSILNPEFTLSLPHRQVVAGIYDAFNHICEQYFSGSDDNVSDSIAEGTIEILAYGTAVKFA